VIPGILAAPLGRDQPTDIWLAAQIRFFLKPRRRIWDQSGIKDLVTITVPKHEIKNFSNNLSKQEVNSRLKALADTIDSRGWVIKNVDVNLYTSPIYSLPASDRLIDPSSLPQTVPDIDISASDDIMDVNNNPVAHHFEEIVHQAGKAQMTNAINKMKAALQEEKSKVEKPISEQPTPYKSIENNVLSEPTLYEKQQILNQVKKEKILEQMIKPHHKEVDTPEEIVAEETAQKAVKDAQLAQKAQAVTPPKDPGIVNLANTDDLSVASIASLANRKNQNNNEVIIKLR